jgi:hypothetical protein
VGVSDVGVPNTVVRARQLMLGLTVLSVAAIGLLFYTSASFEPAGGSVRKYSPTETFLYGLGAALILAVPLAISLTVLSAKVGSGRNWARITSIAMMMSLALVCTCAGALTSFAGLSTAPDDINERSSTATVAFGIIGLAIGGVSIVACILLLMRGSHAYFDRYRSTDRRAA